MSLGYATIPAYCLPSVEAVGASLYEALEAAGHLPVRALQRLRAIAATAEQAEMLEIDPGTPGLFIERRGFLADGRTAEFTQSRSEEHTSELPSLMRNSYPVFCLKKKKQLR